MRVMVQELQLQTIESVSIATNRMIEDQSVVWTQSRIRQLVAMQAAA